MAKVECLEQYINNMHNYYYDDNTVGVLSF